MGKFNQKKLDALIISVVYLGTLYYLINQGAGRWFSIFLSVPGTFVVLLAGGVLVEIMSEILKPFWKWLQR